MQHTHYPTGNGKLYPIKRMTKAYLKDTINFIKLSGLNKEYLSTLRKELKIKSAIVFINITEQP